MDFKNKIVHLMGIGGCGVGALVPLLQQKGAICTGCDLKKNKIDAVDVFLGHDPIHLDGVDILVYSSAIPIQHEEIREAKEKGLIILSRPACLAELMRDRSTIAIAGSHGKTTTTWMLAHLMIAHGRDPVVMFGGSTTNNNGAHPGKESVFIAEVDESDGGFLHVDPYIAIVTNLDDEHCDHYGGFEGLKKAFKSWLARVPETGLIIVPETGLPEEILEGVVATVVRCGENNISNLTMNHEDSVVSLNIDEFRKKNIKIPMPGFHNVMNAIMAFSAMVKLHDNVDFSLMEDCKRVRRRFSSHQTKAGIRVVEDYAHHPKEIKVTIETAKIKQGRILVIFQPHRYSRTKAYFEEFSKIFNDAYAVALLPIYSADEEPMLGINSRILSEKMTICRGDHMAQYVPCKDAAVSYITGTAEKGDTILVLGAGDVGELANVICIQLDA